MQLPPKYDPYYTEEEIPMITWKNTDTLTAYQEMMAVEKLDLVAAMSGENGAQRVKNYSIPMGGGMAFNYGARPVDDKILAVLAKFAEEQQLAEKFAALYNGDVINTGEKRRVLHHMCRGQLGDDALSAKDAPKVVDSAPSIPKPPVLAVL